MPFVYKLNKAPGVDTISNEQIKLLDEENKDTLLTLVNQILATKTIPTAWKHARVACIYKQKGENSDPANYRPISLLNTFL